MRGAIIRVQRNELSARGLAGKLPSFPRSMRLISAALVLAACAPASARQTTPPDTSVVRLPALEVRASRMAVGSTRLPLARSTVERDDATRDTQAAPSLADLFHLLPGVEIEDRGHLALGERVTVRGMGGRAAFGVRGVQMLLDGTPLTLPDGQSVTEIVEPAIVRRAEILRGPSGRLWGNGSGGVIALQTAASTLEPAGMLLRASGGAFGTRQFLAEAVADRGRTRLQAYGSYRRTDGWRQHSAGRLIRGGSSAVIPVGSTSVLRLGLAAVDQDVEHPGSLTREEQASDPSAADPRYADTASGKRSRQIQGVARLVAAAAGGVLEADIHGSARHLDNPLPFAWIGIDRRVAGLRLGWNRVTGNLTWRVGADAAVQRDDRANAENVDGSRGGPTSLDQRERVRYYALSAVAEWAPTEFLAASAGVRVDRVSIRLQDRLPADGDDSGTRTFDALSPGVSVRWTGAGWTAFAGWSTAFDAPTTTELVNTPDGSAGFNPDLGPQDTRGLETGFRTGSGAWFLEVSLYALHVRDLLASFQDQQSGRTYYRNTGGARHRGVEVLYEWSPSDRIRVRGFAAFQRFRFRDGNDLPGLPGRRLGVAVEGGSDRLRGEVRMESVTSRYGDDANTGRVPGYAVVDFRLYHAGMPAGRTVVRPFVELRNAFDGKHVASIVVNARGERYFEPAAGRYLVAGLSMRIR